jgi:hypothetical protein
MTLSPRDALRALLRVLDEVEASECPICLKPSSITEECVKHDPKFARALREAKHSLDLGDD